MDDVYVVEVAVTGPKGAPKDRVAEVAVCRVLSDGSDFETVYNDSVALDPLDLGKEPLDYMEANYGITPEHFSALAENAMTSMKRVFLNDRLPLKKEDVIAIYARSYS